MDNFVHWIQRFDRVPRSSVLNAFSPRFYWRNRLPPSDERWYLSTLPSINYPCYYYYSLNFRANMSIPSIFFFLCEYSRDRFVINVSREFCCVEISTNFLEVFTSVSIFHRIVEERKEKEKKSIYDLTTIIRWLWVNLERENKTRPTKRIALSAHICH